MGRRKYCSAQPYLDYIGVSDRERKEWAKEQAMTANNLSIVPIFGTCDKGMEASHEKK